MVKAFAIMKRADACIENCLDIAQVTSKPIIQEVENIRTAIRQINVRNQYCLDNWYSASNDPEKLKLQ